MRRLFALVFTMALPFGTACAQDAPSDGDLHGVVAIGAGMVPEYEGASDIQLVPFALADLRWGGMTLELRGLRARFDMASDSRFSIGPIIGARLERDDADGAVGLLPEIDTAVEAGAFIGYIFGGDANGQGALKTDLSVVHDVSKTHEGLLATANASYAAVRQARFALSFDIQATWVSSDYARTYFGVDAAGAAASGLPQYRPGAGLKDIGAALTAGYWFDRSIGVIGRIGANYLVAEVTDSPIVDAGSRWQPSAAIALSYRF